VAQDGSHREKATYYHCYALDMYLLATVLGIQHDIALTAHWLNRVEKMAEFLLWIVRPDGSLARFGDDDGGRTIRLADEDYYHPGALLAVAAVLFERADFKQAAGELPEEVFWIFGPEGARRYSRLAQQQPLRSSVWFPEAHLAVMRTGWGPKDLWLACQEQPMGMLTAGHSHEALLSFELVVDGKPLIVDPGTYTYAATGPWRDHFRRLEAHNGVQIDSEACQVPAGPFRWRFTNAVEPLSPADWPERGVKLGYRNHSAGGRWFQHLRTFVVAESAQAVSLQDDFEGMGKHRLTFWLHFAPGCRLHRKGQREFEIELGDTRVLLVLEGFGICGCPVWEGSQSPVAGWVSPGFDHKLPAPTLCLKDEAELPATRTIRLTVQSNSEQERPIGTHPLRRLRQTE
jgi:hypothetical protein